MKLQIVFIEQQDKDKNWARGTTSVRVVYKAGYVSTLGYNLRF